MPEWERVKLGEVLTLRKEFITIDDTQTYKRCRAQWRAQGVILRDIVPGTSIKTKKQQVCRAGEFLVAEIDAKEGGFGIVPDALDGSVVSSHYFLFQVDETLLDGEYLGYFTRTDGFMSQIKAQGSTNYSAVRPANIAGYEIPLPPLPEQRRIVARVKGLLEKVEEARRLKEGVQMATAALNKALRNEIFQKLARCVPSRRLDEVVTVQLGKMLSDKARTGIGTTPYLRNANIKWDRLDLSSIYSMDFDEREKEKFSLAYGDILMCEGGNIGQSAMWKNEVIGCCYQKALHRIRRINEEAEPDFILQHLFWASETGQFNDAKTQTTIAHLPAVKLKAQPFFLPNLEEQRKIIRILHKQRDMLKDATMAQNVAQAELDALPASILAQAFAGAL